MICVDLKNPHDGGRELTPPRMKGQTPDSSERPTEQSNLSSLLFLKDKK